MNIPVSSSEAITEESLVQDFAILWTQLSQPIQDSIKESTLGLKSLTAIHIRINALCRDTVVQSTNLLFIQGCNTITRGSRELEAKIFEKVKSIMESSKSSTLLQSIGDHIVWRDGNYVKKSPYRSRLTVEEVEQSIDFFDLNFGEFSPKTQVFDILGSYCIVQPYINGYQLGDYLQKKGTDLNPNIKKSIENFARKALAIYNETGIVFNLIGSPYGMKGDLTNSSNILVIDTEESICIPDNILSKNMIRDSSLIRKIKNMILPGRYRRSQRFKMILQEMLSLTK